MTFDPRPSIDPTYDRAGWLDRARRSATRRSHSFARTLETVRSPILESRISPPGMAVLRWLEVTASARFGRRHRLALRRPYRARRGYSPGGSMTCARAWARTAL